MIPGKIYAESERQYFPAHWDEKTRELVEFMIFEGYNAGYRQGYELGQGTGKGEAINLITDVIEKLQPELKGS